MTRSIPFHKQTDVSKQAGQQTFDRMPFLKHSTAEPQQELYLSDYIAKKDDNPKRITFKEWLKKSSFVEPDETVYCWLEECWNAALKQGKL
jgi:hypothetical protein